MAILIPSCSELKDRIEAARTGGRGDAGELDLQEWRSTASRENLVGALDAAILQLNLHRFSSVVLGELQLVSGAGFWRATYTGYQPARRASDIGKGILSLTSFSVPAPSCWQRSALTFLTISPPACRIGWASVSPRMIENDKGSLVGDQVLERLIHTARDLYDQEGRSGFLKSVIFSAP